MPLDATVVGKAMVCTRVPAVVYSSKNAAVAVVFRAAEPLPERKTTRLPGVNGAARAVSATKVASRTAGNRRVSLFMIGVFMGWFG